VRIVILPPWWSSWWAYLVFAIAFVSAVYYAVRIILLRRARAQRIIFEKQEALFHERARISRDMHDDMGSGLSQIAILTEVLKSSLHGENAADQLGRISHTAKDLVDSMGQIIWAMSPENNGISNLVAYIREYAGTTLDIHEISYTISLPDDLPKDDLGEQARRNIFLVVKETLNNIVKHSAASRVDIELQCDQASISLIIRDNGRGFDTGNVRRFGNGLLNMKKRMADIGGSFTITSQPGEGTATQITFPA
jgi:signal transduction histidine kinase